jgi:hypothetical protein
MKTCALLFSGGTDSTCAAALCAEKFDQVHLLTVYERSTATSPIPLENLDRLRKHFGAERFILHVISTDRLVRELSYRDYFSMLLKHGLFMLSTPGFSSLSWHLRTLHFCLENGIEQVFDGMTKELLHLPGHSPAFRELITKMYASYGIEFSSPVMDWPVPPDQRMLDRLIVDRHGFVASQEAMPQERTTGKYLHELGIFPHPNVKGSLFDHRMQHDCYPFVVFNMFVFWYYLSRRSLEDYTHSVKSLFMDRVKTATEWLEAARRGDSQALSLFAPVEITY